MKKNIFILFIFLLFGQFLFAQLPNIEELEYYFDTDPGFGNGTEISFTSDSIIDIYFDADISLLNVGYHKLFIRLKDANGNWSLTWKQDIYKSGEPATDLPLPDIVASEYYFDVDPGFGNGVDIPFSSDSLVEVDFEADISGLDVGYHKLFVRSKDENGSWSLIYKQDIFKSGTPTSSEPLPHLVAMEYYFDIDPGFGNGVDIPLSSDSLVEVDFDADISGLDVGYHKLFVRTKDEHGSWSLVYKQDIYRAGDPTTSLLLPQIVALEYYIDVDLGFGNGIDVPISSDSLINIDFTADITMLDVGYHKFFVRAKDENGCWSHVYKQDVYRAGAPTSGEPLPQIVAVEYFIDTDPGFGSGVNVPITADSIIDELLVADISGLDVGEHNLLYRVKDENGHWSLTHSTPFYLMGLKAFLHGSYDAVSSMMNTTLNEEGLIPLEQPFDSNPDASWFYEGEESVTSIPNEDVVDWVLVQIRDASTIGGANSNSIIESRPVFLLKDGSVVGLDGFSHLTFLNQVENNLYVVIYHRNHMGIMSATEVPQSGAEAFTYDFTISEGQVYGGNSAHIELNSGVWGLSSGDGNGDNAINTSDKNDVWAVEAGTDGYLQGDYNMSGKVDNKDKNDKWLESQNKSSPISD